MELTILGDEPRLTGFRHWWLKDVVGYDLNFHCIQCLLGRRDRQITPTMHLNVSIPMRGSLVYLCGVAQRWRWDDNFHAVAEACPGSSFELQTFNGLTVRFTDARRILIEPLPDGWSGLPKSFTTCRNFQFAVQMKQRQLRAELKESAP